MQATSSHVGSHCSRSGGFVSWESPAQTHSCCAVPWALQRRPSTLCTLLDFSVPAPSYPQNCPQEPCGHHVLTHRASCHGTGGVSGSPHLGPLPARGAAEAKAVKPKKLLRRLRGCLGCISSQQFKWKPAPEVLGLAFSGQVFHVAFQEEGQVLSSGGACQHQLWCDYAQMHTHPRCMALAQLWA